MYPNATPRIQVDSWVLYLGPFDTRADANTACVTRSARSIRTASWLSSTRDGSAGDSSADRRSGAQRDLGESEHLLCAGGLVRWEGGLDPDPDRVDRRPRCRGGPFWRSTSSQRHAPRTCRRTRSRSSEAGTAADGSGCSPADPPSGRSRGSGSGRTTAGSPPSSESRRTGCPGSTAVQVICHALAVPSTKRIRRRVRSRRLRRDDLRRHPRHVDEGRCGRRSSGPWTNALGDRPTTVRPPPIRPRASTAMITRRQRYSGGRLRRYARRATRSLLSHSRVHHVLRLVDRVTGALVPGQTNCSPQCPQNRRAGSIARPQVGQPAGRGGGTGATTLVTGDGCGADRAGSERAAAPAAGAGRSGWAGRARARTGAAGAGAEGVGSAASPGGGRRLGRQHLGHVVRSGRVLLRLPAQVSAAEQAELRAGLVRLPAVPADHVADATFLASAGPLDRHGEWPDGAEPSSRAVCCQCPAQRRVPSRAIGSVPTKSTASGTVPASRKPGSRAR